MGEEQGEGEILRLRLRMTKWRMLKMIIEWEMPCV
jgi:hypothetical protein